MIVVYREVCICVYFEMCHFIPVNMSGHIDLCFYFVYWDPIAIAHVEVRNAIGNCCMPRIQRRVLLIPKKN